MKSTEQLGVALKFIPPGRPIQNGFIERFKRTDHDGKGYFPLFLIVITPKPNVVAKRHRKGGEED